MIGSTDPRLKGKKLVPYRMEIPLEPLNLVNAETFEFETEPLKLTRKNRSTVTISTETLILINELKQFYDASSLEEVIRHGSVSLIDKSLVRTHDRETIDKLCKLRKRLSPKIP